MREKRGQLSQGFIYVIGAVIIILLCLFGYSSIKSFIERQCETEIIKFQKELTLMANKAANDEGSIKEQVFKVPCGVERVYFVDYTKDVPLEPFGEFPSLKNSVRDKVKANAFLIKNGEIKIDFNVGALDLEFPYFICSHTRDGRLSLFFEGKGDSSEFSLKEAGKSCTFEEPLPVRMKGEDFVELVFEVEDIEFEDVDTTREMKVEEGATNVVVKNKGNKKIKYLEKIPKCAVGDVNKAIVDGEIEFPSDTHRIIKPDPLVVWHLSPGVEFVYKLNKIIDDACKRKFGGVPVKEGSSPIQRQIVDQSTKDAMKLMKGHMQQQLTDIDTLSDTPDGIKSKMSETFQDLDAGQSTDVVALQQALDYVESKLEELHDNQDIDDNTFNHRSEKIGKIDVKIQSDPENIDRNDITPLKIFESGSGYNEYNKLVNNFWEEAKSLEEPEDDELQGLKEIKGNVPKVWED